MLVILTKPKQSGKIIRLFSAIARAGGANLRGYEWRPIVQRVQSVDGSGPDSLGKIK
jgi:hypothetical protein